MTQLYLSDPANMPIAERATEMDADEIEAIVGRFRSNSHRAGQLRGKVVIKGDSVTIRQSFGNKILWGKKKMTPEEQIKTHTDKLIADGLWRDISEAPRDASKVIITDGFAETWVAFWAEKQQQFCAYNCGDDYFSVSFYTNELTHFRPLPDDRLANALKVAWDTLETIYYADSGDSPQTTEAAKQALAEIERIARREK